MKERTQHQEKLSIVAREAFAAFQSEVAEYHDLVVVSKQIAVIDCLMSLAQTAAASGYCKPRFVAEPELKIVAGRHPMVGSLGRVISSDLMPNPTGGNAERRGICPI